MRAVVTGTGAPLGAGLADALRPAYEVVAEDDPAAFDGGVVDALVLAAIVPEALAARALIDVDDAAFERIWEGTMRTTTAWLQAVFPPMRDAGRGRVVLVTPTVSMSGAAGLAPLCAAVEAQRVLAKATARQWGRHGITVNCLATAGEVVGVVAGAQALAPPALGRPGDPAADLGPVLRFLLSDDAAFLTGATLAADGGVWMAP